MRSSREAARLFKVRVVSPYMKPRTIDMPFSRNRTADSQEAGISPQPAHSDIWRVEHPVTPHHIGEASGARDSVESAEFREVIAYMRGVADAIGIYERETLAAPSTRNPMPVTTNSRRVTLPYFGPNVSTFEDVGAERGSGIRFKNAVPSSDLYELAGVEQAVGE
jgi:hypothetical protein